MSFIDFKEVTSNNAGTTVRYGGNDTKEIMQILNGKVVANRRPRILNEWLWVSTLKVEKTAEAGLAEVLQEWKVSDDTTSYIKIENQSPVDGQFQPKIVGHTAILGAIRYIGYTTVGNDTGTTPILAFDGVRVGEAAVTTRPIFAVRNLSTAVFTISPTTITSTLTESITKTSQASVAELLHEWKVSDASTHSFIQIENATTTDGLFVPQIKSRQGGTSTAAALNIFAETTGGGDVGAVPMFLADVRISPSTTIATRPLFDFRNNAISKFTINANGDVSEMITAQAAVSEVVHKWNVSDGAASGGISFLNLVNTAAVFSPRIQCYNAAATNASPGLTLDAYIADAQDSGAVPICHFRAVRSAGSPIATRPLFKFSDWSNKDYLTINPTNITSTVQPIVNKTAEAGIAETLQEWMVSDTTTSGIVRLKNASATDSVFAPWLEFTQTASTGQTSLLIHGIGTTTDSGTTPIIAFDSRKSDATALVTRPLFQFRNAGTAVLTINATTFDFINKSLIKVKDIAVRNPADTFSTKIVNGAQTADFDLAIPVLTANDTLITLATAQTITGFKVFSGASGASFRTGVFRITNPGVTFNYIFDASAITANRNILLPLLTANDTLVLEAHPQTLAEKTISPYLDFDDTTTPANPAAGIRRMFVDSVTGEVSVRTSAGTTVSLEAQGGGGGGGDVFLGATNTFGDFNNTFRSSRLRIANPANTFVTTIVNSAITANRNLSIPLLTADDAVMTTETTQNVGGIKVLLDNNLRLTNPALTFNYIIRTSAITATRDITLPLLTGADVFLVQNLEQNVVGVKNFLNSTLKLLNPASTFAYTVVPSAITANRNITVPLLTGNDTLAMEAFTQTLTNKTISAASNTITDASIAAGDILKGDGTKFLRFGRGTSNQVLATNAAGTDLEWKTISAGGGDVFLGQANTFGDFDNKFRSGKLKLTNPANTFDYVFTGAAITANRTVTMPLLTGNDVLATEAFAQTLTNKTIAAGSNTISGIVDAHISAHTSTKVTITAKGQLNSALVYTDQANTFGAFDQQFKTSRLIVRNVADTFGYLIAGSAITADRTVTLPLLTGNDVVVTEAFTQTLTNKTVNSTDNTITATSQATGDILKNNGTKFVRLARGTSLQVLRVNSGATDLEYASLDSERVGKSTASGNGSTTVFNIAHGLGSNPTYAFISVAQSGSTNITRSYTTDATNIVVTFSTAPSSGASNVIIYWRVVA